MHLRVAAALAVVFLAFGVAYAASPEVRYGPAPGWIIPPPPPTDTPTREGAAVRVAYADYQTRLSASGAETYSAFRVKVLTPAGLVVGNVTAAWNPSSDQLTVHNLKIIRDGQSIDVLAMTKFRVIERENNLAYAMLDGQLTAVLQVPGLEVGDELEFSATLRRKDATLGDHFNGFLGLPAQGGLGAYRMRLVWPKDGRVRWTATPDLGKAEPRDRGDEQELIYELRDPASAIGTDGAPARFNLRRRLEYSSFSTWSDLSHLMWPLFEAAEGLAPESPVRAEAAKIAASTTDPRLRAEAALRLVQDRIRYVYVGLDGGNYHPANADETWARKFGDCKAKTALLLAILKELGVPAEAALVNMAGGDGLNEHLPSLDLFDHVLVRATIGSNTYWLDGARVGDRHLSTLVPPLYRWVLPVRAGAADLEGLKLEAAVLPQVYMAVNADMSAGFTAPAKVTATQVLRGEGVYAMQTQLAAAPADDADRLLKAYWRQLIPWVEPVAVSYRYDEAANTLALTMGGEGKPDWEGDDRRGHALSIYGAGFSPPAEFRRPAEQDQAAPWVTAFPSYKCWTTNIKLPPNPANWRWDYRAAPVNERMGGVIYWRQAALEGGVMRTTMSRKTYLPEITAAEANAVNKQLPTFDNNISRVFQRPPGGKFLGAHISGGQPAADWQEKTFPCAPPTDGGATAH
jgi:transglutaminase-like putative cysteine protease